LSGSTADSAAMDSLAVGWLVDLVEEYIGDFVDVDKKMFSTSVWNGDVELKYHQTQFNEP
jgi:hypothetical protein